MQPSKNTNCRDGTIVAAVAVMMSGVQYGELSAYLDCAVVQDLALDITYLNQT